MAPSALPQESTPSLDEVAPALLDEPTPDPQPPAQPVEPLVEPRPSPRVDDATRLQQAVREQVMSTQLRRPEVPTRPRPSAVDEWAPVEGDVTDEVDDDTSSTSEVFRIVNVVGAVILALILLGLLGS